MMGNMYCAHFGLADKPFRLMPDPGYLFMSPRHRMGLASLEYGIAEGDSGFTVMTGEVGAGKTTLVRRLLANIDDTELTIGYIDHTSVLDASPLAWVVAAFGEEPGNDSDAALMRRLQHFLINEYGAGRRSLLIIDEAQNLSAGALETLRMLTNINAGRDCLLHIMLVGQPQLLQLLQHPDLAQVAQRVVVEYHLNSLGAEETGAYIRHRLDTAGGDPELFSEDAIDAVHYFSAGVPRLINVLCDYALLYGFANDLERIDLDTILAVVQGRRIGGINHHAGDHAEREAIRQRVLQRTGTDLASSGLEA